MPVLADDLVCVVMNFEMNVLKMDVLKVYGNDLNQVLHLEMRK